MHTPEIIDALPHDVIIVYKPAGVPSMNSPLPMLSVEEWLLKKYTQCHFYQRIDTPVSGIMLVSVGKTVVNLSKLKKSYLAVVEQSHSLLEQGTLTNHLIHDPKSRKARVVSPAHVGAKEAQLNYEIKGQLDRYDVVKVDLETGRFHQIRCQLAHHQAHIKGDVKYGARRSNKDRSIHLHAHEITFSIDGKEYHYNQYPRHQDNLWQTVIKLLEQSKS